MNITQGKDANSSSILELCLENTTANTSDPFAPQNVLQDLMMLMLNSTVIAYIAGMSDKCGYKKGG